MLSIPLLVNQLRGEYPQFTFSESGSFRWSGDTKTIHVDPSVSDHTPFVLHELGHALLDHKLYHRDIDLLKIERDAWHYAVTKLAPQYGIVIRDNIVQDNLDTYREWLHARSLCPSCKMTGLQGAVNTYSCLACGCRWKSNDSRGCALRRYSISN